MSLFIPHKSFLFSEEEYNNAKMRDELSCVCEQCGKQFMRTKRELSKITKESVLVTESALSDKFASYLLTESGELVDNAVDILSVIVEKTDYEKYDIYPIVEKYLDIIIK